MVNIPKRMRVLKPVCPLPLVFFTRAIHTNHNSHRKYAGPTTNPANIHSQELKTYLPYPQLLSLRHGPGAAILPQDLPQQDPTTASDFPSSQQQLLPSLLRIRLDFPSGNGPASKGARAFWRNHLRRLKYHNPALPITVNQNAEKGTPGNPGPAWRLFLDFEGDEKALRELATEPKNARFKELMEDQLRPRPRSEINPTDMAGEGSEARQSVPSSPTWSDLQQQPPSLSKPSSQDQQPSLTSTRTISLPVLNRPAGALWFWFQQRTKCVDVPESDSDKQLASELAEHAIKAEEDRKLVKKGMDQVKAKKEMLSLARQEVSKMRAE
jgi:Mitochondrial ribosomal protein L51 / S25 / CI-B8 domain